MSARLCAKCGGPLPVQTGRGRRRIKCETCSPSRVKPRRASWSKGLSPKGLVAATRAELDAAGVAGSMAGQAALILAERVEFGQDSGSAVAQMVRQLHESLARALAGVAPAVADPVEVARARLRSV